MEGKLHRKKARSCQLTCRTILLCDVSGLPPRAAYLLSRQVRNCLSHGRPSRPNFPRRGALRSQANVFRDRANAGERKWQRRNRGDDSVRGVKEPPECDFGAGTALRKLQQLDACNVASDDLGMLDQFLDRDQGWWESCKVVIAITVASAEPRVLTLTIAAPTSV